ncbi:protein EspF [Escherichia coli]|nr:protein EspF [Escherichia coli]EFI2430115.1 protein EspF [Escherichia coli]EFL0753456.1 protein EspF [Escherichia coli]EGE7860151.1 protein EspF [Escherichia coli]EIA1200484.1 protein EspF [Escherichia coli]
MLNGISNAVSTIGRHLRGVASRVGSAGVSGFSVAPQTVRLTPVRFHSPFSPGSSNINARTTFNMSHMSHMSHMSQMSRMSQMATSFTPTRPAPPPPTSGQASGSAGLPPIAQALKDHLAAYELSKASETVSFKPTRQAPPPPTSGQASESGGLPPIAQALKDHLAAYEQSKKV